MATEIWTQLTPAGSVVAAAIVALTGVILSAFISALVSRRSTYISTVTTERSKWIDKLRTNISELVGATGYLHYKIISAMMRSGEDAKAGRDELVKRIEVLVSLVKLQLNPSGPVDSNIIKLIDRLLIYAEWDDDRYRILERGLLRHSQWLLKDEWEKVKYESRLALTRPLSWPKRWLRTRAYRRFCNAEGSIKTFVIRSQDDE
jgi:hypothetical protein